MAKTTTIQARIDPKVKKRAKSILDKLNITMSEAISMFLTQITLNKGIPFDIKIPNELTAQTLHKTKKKKNCIKSLVLMNCLRSSTVEHL